MKEIFQRLDKAFEHRHRLAIMSVLMVNDWVDFSALKEITGVTDGNLASHIKSLEKMEYITYEKLFLNKKPKTNYKATTKGKKAFRLHLKALEDILKI